MLRSLNNLLGSVILAKDGELGKVHDFLFDDRAWTVRYLVVETGSWLSSRQVLVSPASAGPPDWEKLVIPVDLTMDQVRQSPDIGSDKPVSRQEEMAMSQYYGWPAYWSVEPPLMPVGVPVKVNAVELEGDRHLRSAREVISYVANAADGEIGSVDDLILEDADWFIRYVVVKTGSWFSDQKLLLSAQSVGSISWANRQVDFVHARGQM